MNGARFWLSLALLTFAKMASAEESDRCDGAMGGRNQVDVYDPAAPMDKRQEALRALRTAATTAECPGQAYALGLLYRHGPDLPGNLLDRDPEQARSLILASAESGHLTAYSDLAEMELQLGNAREAMKWTQVYLSVLKNHSRQFDRRAGSFDRAGYNSNLLMRAERAWLKQRPKLPRAVITSDLNQYLADRTTSIAQGLARSEAETKKIKEGVHPDLKVKKTNAATCSVDLGRTSAAYATYILEVQPSGAVSRIVLENFSPDPVAGQRLKRCVPVIEFEPFSSDHTQTVRIPVVYGYQRGSSISK